jgi:hypothetical protein
MKWLEEWAEERAHSQGTRCAALLCKLPSYHVSDHYGPHILLGQIACTMTIVPSLSYHVSDYTYNMIKEHALGHSYVVVVSCLWALRRKGMLWGAWLALMCVVVSCLWVHMKKEPTLGHTACMLALYFTLLSSYYVSDSHLCYRAHGGHDSGVKSAHFGWHCRLHLTDRPVHVHRPF